MCTDTGSQEGLGKSPEALALRHRGVEAACSASECHCDVSAAVADDVCHQCRTADVRVDTAACVRACVNCVRVCVRACVCACMRACVCARTSLICICVLAGCEELATLTQCIDGQKGKASAH